MLCNIFSNDTYIMSLNVPYLQTSFLHNIIVVSKLPILAFLTAEKQSIYIKP